ncbi:hypothetical protein C8R46DRAFT_1191544 [Mycena filopes]|nr:hypothetical protein C8R46DRAFT_1191544 [Mycena filopes]
MDPLKCSDLTLLENWGAFQPDMKGYLPPQELALWPAYTDIESQIRGFVQDDYIRDNDTPFLTSSVGDRMPTTRLTIRGETFTVPVSHREMAFLSQHLGNAAETRLTVSANEVQIVSDEDQRMGPRFAGSVASVIRKLKMDGDFRSERTLAVLEVFKAGSHEMSTTPVNDDHIATTFMILPATFTNPADIRFQAKHDIVRDVQLPADITQTASAIGVYTGVSDARLEVGAGCEIICLTYHTFATVHTDGPCIVPRLDNISGASAPMRDAFCAWRHALNSGSPAPELVLLFLFEMPKCASAFKADATLLCTLAPLAKAYGFNLYIGDIVHTQSTKQEVQHEYKEYYEEIEMDKLYMEDKPETEYDWENFRGLGGDEIAHPTLLELATKMLKGKGDLRDDLMEVDVEEDFEVYDESSYYTTVIFQHIRKASLLFIAP